MTHDEAVAVVRKLAERRREKAQAYADAAVAYEERALSADEALNSIQREFLINLGMGAQRSAQSMRRDADALEALLP